MWKRYVSPLAKIGLSLGIIATIGWAIVTLNTEGEVQRSDALIWDMSAFERTNTQKFASALKKLGHEPPRVYNYNGNEVYFSTRKTRRDPDEAVQRYQRIFAAEGVNEKAYGWTPPTADNLKEEANSPQTRERYAAMLSGQMVPQWVGDQYASMGGGLIKGQPETREEFAKQSKHIEKGEMKKTVRRLENVFEECDDQGDLNIERRTRTPRLSNAAQESKRQCDASSNWSNKSDMEMVKRFQILVQTMSENKEIFADCPALHKFARKYKKDRSRKFSEQVFESFRSIEMFKQNPNKSTTVTAVWGDSSFNPKQALKGPPEDAETTVPACPSCTHGFRYSSKPNGQNYVTNVLRSPRGPKHLEQYYLRKLGHQGWERTESNRQLHRVLSRVDRRDIQGQHLGFKRDDKYLMVSFRRKGDKTTITTMETKRPRTGDDVAQELDSLLP